MEEIVDDDNCVLPIHQSAEKTAKHTLFDQKPMFSNIQTEPNEVIKPFNLDNLELEDGIEIEYQTIQIDSNTNIDNLLRNEPSLPKVTKPQPKALDEFENSIDFKSEGWVDYNCLISKNDNEDKSVDFTSNNGTSKFAIARLHQQQDRSHPSNQNLADYAKSHKDNVFRQCEFIRNYEQKCMENQEDSNLQPVNGPVSQVPSEFETVQAENKRTNVPQRPVFHEIVSDNQINAVCLKN